MHVKFSTPVCLVSDETERIQQRGMRIVFPEFDLMHVSMISDVKQ